jgi:hypothetical protein
VTISWGRQPTWDDGFGALASERLSVMTPTIALLLLKFAQGEGERWRHIGSDIDNSPSQSHEMGHTQTRTPICMDNTTVEGVINNKIQPKRTKAMDMRFH